MVVCHTFRVHICHLKFESLESAGGPDDIGRMDGVSQNGNKKVLLEQDILSLMISSLFFNFRQFHRLGLIWLVFQCLKSRIRNRLHPNLEKIFLSLFSSRIEKNRNSPRRSEKLDGPRNQTAKEIGRTEKKTFQEIERLENNEKIKRWKRRIKNVTGQLTTTLATSGAITQDFYTIKFLHCSQLNPKDSFTRHTLQQKFHQSEMLSHTI